MITLEEAYKIVMPKGEELKRFQQKCKENNITFNFIVEAIFDTEDSWVFWFIDYFDAIAIDKNTGKRYVLPSIPAKNNSYKSVRLSEDIVKRLREIKIEK